MANLEVELKHTNGKTTLMRLIDSFGPLNKWECQDRNAFTPSFGEFTNQMGSVVPTTPAFWVLNALDIDRVSVGATGSGEVISNSGTFPEGMLNWKVLRFFL